MSNLPHPAPTDPLPHPLLSEREAARLLGLTCSRTLCEWRRLRKGPPYRKVGRLVRYTVDDLLAFAAPVQP
jgi:hypothetical protein